MKKTSKIFVAIATLVILLALFYPFYQGELAPNNTYTSWYTAVISTGVDNAVSAYVNGKQVDLHPG